MVPRLSKEEAVQPLGLAPCQLCSLWLQVSIEQPITSAPTQLEGSVFISSRLLPGCRTIFRLVQDLHSPTCIPVSYTHLTLPTRRTV